MFLGIKAGPVIVGHTSRQRSGPGLFGSIILLGLVALFFAWPFYLGIGKAAWFIAVPWWLALLAGPFLVKYRHRRATLSKKGPPPTYHAIAGDWQCDHHHLSQPDAQACSVAHMSEKRAAEPAPAAEPGARADDWF